MSKESLQEIIKLATNARQCALARYSNFCVGAALEAEAGGVYTGCNVESAAYEQTICAERGEAAAVGVSLRVEQGG